ncbi:UNVERIFIED_CONTAM: hypothetical protein Slati_3821400 [Sesamum latifolium]|uniref:Reverse transcriptase n=1 Tax=Sesamum latifolium TaxID=2727402 RepID=A0AAW2U5U1_9LAMI
MADNHQSDRDHMENPSLRSEFIIRASTAIGNLAPNSAEPLNSEKAESTQYLPPVQQTQAETQKQNPSHTTPKKSFAEAVSNATANRSIHHQPADLRKYSLADHNPQPLGVKSLIRGRLTLSFTDAEIEELAAPYRFSLVEKFSHGAPPYSQMHQLIARLGIQGAFTVSMINSRHTLISLSSESYYSRLWLRRIWFLQVDELLSPLENFYDFETELANELENELVEEGSDDFCEQGESLKESPGSSFEDGTIRGKHNRGLGSLDKQKHIHWLCLTHKPQVLVIIEPKVNLDDRLLWDELRNIDPGDEPWLLDGDFNIILHASERKGGAPPKIKTMEDFGDMLLDCGLQDAGFEGAQFTWSRNHCPLLLSVATETKKGPAPFRFQNMWTKHHAFKQCVLTSWQFPINGKGMFKLQQKLYRLKAALKNWNWEVFGNIFQNIKEAEQRSKAAEERYDNDPSDTNLIAMNKATAELTLALSMEECYWRQKSACKWLSEGEKTTKYFHSLVKKKRKNSHIHQIQHNDVILSSRKLYSNQWLSISHELSRTKGM